MSLFKTRRERPVVDRRPATFDRIGEDAATASVEGVTLDVFVTFIATVGQRAVTPAEHELIAQQLGFPAGRYDLIRNLWMGRVYSSPSLAREFGVRLDEARTHLG
jgi:hypothetical protein